MTTRTHTAADCPAGSAQIFARLFRWAAQPLLALIAAALSLTFAAPSLAQEHKPAVRERLALTQDWRFQKGDPEGLGATLSYPEIKPWLLPSGDAFRTQPSPKPEGPAPGAGVSYAQPGFDDGGWRVLDLPHDWGIEGPFQQDLPGETGKLPWFGVAWYRKQFQLPASDQGRQLTLQVDGAMSYAAVWCNGQFIGGWPYGYASWQLDLSSCAQAGQLNTLAIRIDNPADSSRWYPGGGLYRNVWLIKSAPVHVAPWGTFITTPKITPQSATITVRTAIANLSTATASIRYSHLIFKADKEGRAIRKAVVKGTAGQLSLAAGATKPVSQNLQLPAPQLWSPDTPTLYVLVTQIEQDGKLVDRYETPFGVRNIEFTANDGLHLNGKKFVLQGVNQHHDLGALGAAFNLRAAQRQLEILKEMGVNAIRMSHNPPAPELLDLCDRMGFLAIDELSDTWTVAKKPNGYAKLFKDWAEADLRSLIRRDRNHPSVMLWSIGNEVGEQRSKPAMAQQLSDIARSEDSTRLSTSGNDQPAAASNGFQNGIGVYGFNYKPHLYEKFHNENPNKPVYGSETASTISSRGEYLFPVDANKAGGKIGYHMSSYDLYAPAWAQNTEQEFAAQDRYPFVAGEFVWSGFDYLGEPTPFNNDLTVLTNFHTEEERKKAEAELKAVGKLAPPSRSSYFGIVDLAGFKKDRFYLYQARWRPELPMAHILPHWNWPDRVGQVTPVHVYTSGDEGELFLNGQSLGRKKRLPGETRLRWDEVVYAPGELKVQTYKQGKPWAQDAVKTSGPATKIALNVDRAAIQADGRDLAFITATLLDKDGNPVPNAKPKLTFSASASGEIVATDNGDPTDHTTFSSPTRAAFNGLALAIVRAKKAGDAVRVQATGDGLAAAQITIQTSAAGAR